MKRLLSLLIILLTITMANSQIKKPDFAYPKTTAENAEGALAQANKKRDAKQALEALIVLTVAKSMIDEQSLPQCIDEISKTADIYKADPLEPLYQLLMAQMYQRVYNSDRWTFDRRELPLTPVPDDITEWSGAQFKDRIIQLCSSAMATEGMAKLSALKVTDYQDIIEVDKLGSVYYPTLADFIYVNVLDIYQGLGIEASTDIYKAAYEQSAAGSAPSMLWLKSLNDTTDDAYAENRKAFEQHSDNPYAGVLLSALSVGMHGDEEHKRFFVAAATEYNRQFPDNPFAPVLSNEIAQTLQEHVNLTMPSVVALNKRFEIECTNYNTTDFSVEVYYLYDNPTDKQTENRYILNLIKDRTPERIEHVTCQGKAPFMADTTLSLTLDAPGYYCVIPVVKGKKNESEYIRYLRCVPVVPITLQSASVRSKADVIVVDAASGAPIEGAVLGLYQDKIRKPKAGVTSAEGMAKIDVAKDKYYHLSVDFKGHTYDFNDISVYTNDYSQSYDTIYAASILTDRAIYHPGDEVNVMAVMNCVDALANDKMERKLMQSTHLRLTLYDVNRQEVESMDVTTDEYGRATATFTLPTEGLTGYYTIGAECPDVYFTRTLGDNRLMVSDYRMPDFEITVDQVACDTPAKGEVTVKGVATAYSGMPMASIDIDVILERTGWFWWYRNNQENLYATKIKTDDQGRFEITLGADLFAEDNRDVYVVKFDAVASNGSAASTQRAFTLEPQYHITASVKTQNVDALKPLIPDVKVTNPEGEEVKLPLVWKINRKDASGITTVASGDYSGSIDISTLEPDQYTLWILPKEEGLANSASLNITVYNMASGKVPANEKIWVLKSDHTLIGDGIHPTRLDIDYATNQGIGYLYYYLERGGNVEYIKLEKVTYGYHKLQLTLPADFTRGSLTLLAVNDVATLSRRITITQQQAQPLKIEGESFRDRLVPGALETWQIKVTNADGLPVEAALALDMYNKALEALEPHGFGLTLPQLSWSSHVSIDNIWLTTRTNTFNSKLNLLKTNSLNSPHYRYLQNIRYYGYVMRDLHMPMVMKSASRSLNAANDEDVLALDAMPAEVYAVETCANECDAESVVTGAGTLETKEPEPEDFDYREADVPMAIWAPKLGTDARGNVCYTFTVPNANTTWRLHALAWSKDLQIGTMMRDFVASKPVMVQPNLPRFMRVGDKATVLATVMNNTDSLASVTTVVEIFNPVSGQVVDRREFTSEINAMQHAVVSVDVNAGGDETAIGYRVRSTNGNFSDGEQAVIRVLSSEAQLIETTPFYLNPGETEFSTKLPKDKGARLTLTFCENPAWTIVTALPGLRTQISDYANSAAAAMFSAAIARGIVKANPAIADALKLWAANPADSALVSMLQRNEDLKAAVLNSTPWVQAAQSETERMANLALIFDNAEVDASINKAIAILMDLQHSDGGWRWGKWCEKSSFWVTSNVLSMLSELHSCGWLPDDQRLHDMIAKALRYYDAEVEKTDMLYAVTRPLFSQSISSNGRSVIAATIKEIKKNWKSYTDPAYKAFAAEALWLNGEKDMARKLMASVAEFGVYTKNQGLKFPSADAIYDYGMLLEAFGMIEPDSKAVDGLRQQLIVRKQGSDWGSAVVTTQVVRSILATGTEWTVPAQGAKIEVGSEVIAPSTPIESSTGWLRTDLSQYGGKTLQVTTPGIGPAYGAVFAQLSRQMEEVKAASCDDLDIEKHLYVREGTDWQVPTELHVGDRVKVVLTIHCKRHLEYVSIIDERPAAFEPVEQLPGWMWSEGVGFYRENRDSATDLHVIYMGPGTYQLSYEMNVNVAGDFSSGVATIQSQYAPEITAHSSGMRLRIY